MKDPYKKQEQLRYKNPIISREAILEYLSKFKSGSNLNKIINGPDQKSITARLQAMIRDGQIIFKKNKYHAVPSSLTSGYLSIRHDGFGLINSDGKDIVLMPRQIIGLIRGDYIKIRFSNKKFKGKLIGVLVEVLNRSDIELYGYIDQLGVQLFPGQVGGFGLLRAEQHSFNKGQKVVARIQDYPSTKDRGSLIIISQLDPINDMRIWAAMLHGLPHHFPKQVIAEANNLSIVKKDGRRDLTELPFVTIDGADAKDFDDAIYVTKTSSGWLLYVAIADVSAYVKKDSELDKEAKIRATSVYFPGQVIPMLPEALSNNLCSLLPETDRAVMLVEMAIDQKGNMLRSKIYRAMIKSHARLTYSQVSSYIDCSDLVPDFWRTAFKNLLDLSYILQKKKHARGALSIERKEQIVQLDDCAKVHRVELKSATQAHKIIELCMLEANETVAKFMIKNNLPGMYREHGEPKPDKYQELLVALANYGITPQGKENQIQELAKLIASSDISEPLLLQLLRSLPQATYTTKQLGHFGLAYKNYCHFTSPIRRYPDLYVHRIIGDFLDRKPCAKDLDSTNSLAQYCSFAERRADLAARDVVQKYLCEFMVEKVGMSFTARIISVHNFGFFIALEQSGIEGLVHVSNLPDDNYILFEESNMLVGQYTDKKFQLGDKVSATLNRVSLENSKIDFLIK